MVKSLLSRASSNLLLERRSGVELRKSLDFFCASRVVAYVSPTLGTRFGLGPELPEFSVPVNWTA